jgi:hypothetical protein
LSCQKISILLAVSDGSGFGEVVRICQRLSGVKDAYVVQNGRWPPPPALGPEGAAAGVLDGRNGHDELHGLFDVWRERSSITAVRSCAVLRFCAWLQDTDSRNWLFEEAFRVRVGIVVSPSAPELRRAFRVAETMQPLLGPTGPPVIVINDAQRLGSDHVQRAVRDSQAERTAYRIRHVPACSSSLARRQIARGEYLTDLCPDTDEFAEQTQDADAREQVLRWWEAASQQLQPLIPASSDTVAVGRNTASLRNRLRAQARTIRCDKKAKKFIELVKDPDVYRTLAASVLDRIKMW